MKIIFNKVFSMTKLLRKFTLLWLAFLLLAACSPSAPSANETGLLHVVATTTIVADVVRQVGGEFVSVETLLPAGADPHSFDPTPQDIAKISDAELVFANGAGLEAFLTPLLESAGAKDKTVEVSQGITLLFAPDAEEELHAQGDPHTWTDPNNVIVWGENIRAALSLADPTHADSYAANAAAYTAQLKEIDAWIREEIAQIPEENRKIVTDHRLLGYYVNEYGLEQVGAIIPGYSSLSEASAQELAKIEDAIRAVGVKAIFVGNTVNPQLAERIAEDTGVRLIYFYTGSLSPADGEAATYLDYLRYNTKAFVSALK
jgi:ABC-type Zn uptake system ZnuABC Zn-binding protein ZnuA